MQKRPSAIRQHLVGVRHDWADTTRSHVATSCVAIHSSQLCDSSPMQSRLAHKRNARAKGSDGEKGGTSVDQKENTKDKGSKEGKEDRGMDARSVGAAGRPTKGTNMVDTTLRLPSSRTSPLITVE